MDAFLGEITTSQGLSGKSFYAFRFTEREGSPVRGEIALPASFAGRRMAGTQLRVEIPYTARSAPLHVRLRLEGAADHAEYLPNPKTNSRWFPVLEETSKGPEEIFLCAFGRINEDGLYNLVVREGYLALFSGYETDLTIDASKYRNEVFLLKALPGNLYQHPTTGVGLIDFLHGNFENNGLAARLQKEFGADNMIVVNAYMDSATGELLLQTREKEEVAHG